MPNPKNKEIALWAIGLTKKEIKQLLWWACVGIARAKSGAFEKTAPNLIKELATGLGIKLPYKPEFNAKIKKYKRLKKRDMKKSSP